MALATAHGQEFQRLFDGKSLKGWHAIGGGAWSAADSSLVGLDAKGAEGAMVSDSSYGDFTLRLKFKWTKGNTGVNFRNIESAGLSKGLQVDIEGAASAGRLYNSEKGGYATAANFPQFYRAGAWNTLIVEARGQRIRVRLNDSLTADYTDAAGRPEGRLGFQLHVNHDVAVAFRDIEIQDLSRPSPIRLGRGKGPGMAPQGAVNPYSSFRADGKALGPRRAGMDKASGEIIFMASPKERR